jgi:hypothetical protein
VATDFRGPVSVNTVTTSLAVIDVSDTRMVAIAFTNTDGTQTALLTVRRRAHPQDPFDDGIVFPEFENVAPGSTKQVDVDMGVSRGLEVLGKASGAGFTGNLTIKPDVGRRP